MKGDDTLPDEVHVKKENGAVDDEHWYSRTWEVRLNHHILGGGVVFAAAALRSVLNRRFFRSLFLQIICGTVFTIIARSNKMRIFPFFAVLIILIETFQYLSFAFFNLFAWSQVIDGPVFNFVGLFSFASLHMYTSEPLYWICFVCILYVTLNFAVVAVLVVREDRRMKWLMKSMRVSWCLVGQVGYVPILFSLLSALSCQVGDAHPAAGVHGECVVGSGTGYLVRVTALPALLLHVLLGFVHASCVFDDNPTSVASAPLAASHGRIALLRCFVKTLMVVLVKFLADQGQYWSFPSSAVALSSEARNCGAAIALAVATTYEALAWSLYPPFYRWWTCQLAAACQWLAAWCFSCAVLSALLDDPSDAGTAVILFILAPLVVVCSVLALQARRRWLHLADIDEVEHPLEVAYLTFLACLHVCFRACLPACVSVCVSTFLPACLCACVQCVQCVQCVWCLAAVASSCSVAGGNA